MDNKMVGERIKCCRKSLGLTQQELANRLGKQRVTIAGYENGRIEPPSTVIFLLSTTFNVSSDFLLGLKEQ